MSQAEILLLSATGADASGTSALLCQLIGEYSGRVLDISYSAVHRHSYLGMVVALPPEADGDALRGRLQRTAESLDLRLDLRSIQAAEYASWAALGDAPGYVLTVLSPDIAAATLARVAAAVSENGFAIAQLERLSDRVAIERLDPCANVCCLEYSLRGTGDALPLRRSLLQLAGELGIDIALQRDDLYRRNRRLVAFDMDSTLIQIEVVDELARVAGCGEEVVRITAETMAGTCDFTTSLRRRVALLKGLPESALHSLADRLPLTAGAERLLLTLKALGYRTAILSGGFEFFGERLRDRLGIDHLYANRLELQDGQLSGRVLEPVIDGDGKAQLLRDLALREGVALEQVIAVGDGANDLPMLSIAGLGIAFRAKPLVAREAGHSLSTCGLDAILYLLGLRAAQALP